MRIGLNATCFNNRPSGANQRFRGIYGALIRARPDWEFLVYEPADCAVAGWFGNAPNVRAISTPLRSSRRLQRTLRGALFWPDRLAQDRLDLFEMFHLPLVRAASCPTVTTIHDARVTRLGASRIGRAIGRAVTRDALRSADLAITVSGTMKSELLAIEPGANIVTIYNGIDVSRFAPPPEEAGETNGPYLLSVGHLEERKNYLQLIEAMSLMRPAHPDLSLVIVGNDGGQRAALVAAIDRLGLAGAVRLLHGIGDAELAGLYRGAAAVVFPSLYEGFGIPVLEAMAARRPLVLSNIAVFAELTEGRGAMFDPLDPVDMARAIVEVLDNPRRQQQLVDYGDRRVRDFGFDHLARQVESAYRQTLKAWRKRTDQG